MRFKRVFFVMLNLQGASGYPSRPHPGQGYIIETLEQQGVKCGVLDMMLGYHLSDLRRKIQGFNPDLIAVTLYSCRYRRAYQLISHIKRITDQPVVIGGPHVSLMGRRSLEESDADLAVKYEGEYPLLELCLGKPLEEIGNLIYRDGEDIKENPSRPFITNLDALPFPKYSPFELKKYSERSIAILSSRGCPYQCNYCSVKTTMGRNFRPRSPKNVISELKYWYSRGYRQFDVNDDTFNVDIKRVYEICDLIQKEKLTNIFLSCWQGMRLDRVDRPLLQRMREVGFYRLGFGVESYNSEILQSIKKGETIEQIDEGVRIACELGYSVILNFMFGFPGETWAGIENSLNFSLKYPIWLVKFHNITPYPGTELFDWLKENKLLLVDPDIYLDEDLVTSRKIIVFRTDSMSMAQRRKAFELGERFTRRIFQRSLERRLPTLGILSKAFAWFMCTKLIWQIRAWLDRYRLTYRGRRLATKFLRLRETG